MDLILSGFLGRPKPQKIFGKRSTRTSRIAIARLYMACSWLS